MAKRVAEKARKHAQTAPAQKAERPAAGAGRTKQTDRLGELEAEVARLQRELADAQARIKSLAEQRELLINRIDWVIDSLHSLNDE